MSETICLIDGDSKTLKRNREILEMFGYKVVAAGEVDGAFPHIAGGTIDLVISDVYLPGLSGIDLLERMRDNKTKIPVLLLGRSFTEEIIERAAATGAIGFFEKPVSTVTLVAFIQKLFGPSNGNGNGKINGNGNGKITGNGKPHSGKPHGGEPRKYSVISVPNSETEAGRNEKNPDGANSNVPAGQTKKNWFFRLFRK